MPGRLFSVNDTGYIECEVTACMKEAANEEIPYMATVLYVFMHSLVYILFPKISCMHCDSEPLF